jgi:hypothetical protein
MLQYNYCDSVQTHHIEIFDHDVIVARTLRQPVSDETHYKHPLFFLTAMVASLRAVNQASAANLQL